MTPNTYGEQRVAELTARREELRSLQAEIAKELAWIEQGIALFSAGRASVPNGGQSQSPRQDDGTGQVVERRRIRGKNMGRTYRDRLIEYLDTVTVSQMPVEVARGMLRRGLIQDYAKEKAGIDSALKRMQQDGEAIHDHEGFRLVDSLRSTVQQNGHP